MNQQVPLDKAASANDLLMLLKKWKGQVHEYNSLLLISLGVLATDEADKSFWKDFAQMLVALRVRHNARLYELSLNDRALLVRMTEHNEVSLIADAKLEILRLIQQYYPEQFGMIDQSRLIRCIDLRLKMSNAIRFLERYEAEERKASTPEIKRLRRLGEQDIDRVVEVNQQVGNEAFARVFVRKQPMAEIQPGGAPVHVMDEYFVGMDALKKHVFLDVELRGSGNIFNQLTITLDRLLLDAFNDANPDHVTCSINLNVESVFTRAFEAFLSTSTNKSFANLAFEFRQSNVLQQYDEYEVAANLIASRQGAIAIDAVFPETVGIVNMQRLHANMAKIFWRQGAEQVLPRFAKEIADMQASGTRVVLARVDDDLGVQVGHDLGITLFQGFHVDDLSKKA